MFDGTRGEFDCVGGGELMGEHDNFKDAWDSDPDFREMVEGSFRDS